MSDLDNIGIYLHDLPSPTPSVKPLLGGRYDNVDQTSDNTSPGGVRTITKGKDGEFTPRVGLVWQPNDVLAFYSSYTARFDPS